MMMISACVVALSAIGGGERLEGDAIPEAVLRRVLAMERRAEVAPDATNRVADDPEAARFGQQLFFEPRLSVSGAVSCASCHDPERAFTDGLRRSVGLAEGPRNAQGLLDIADLPWFTWDGRADSLWSQALHPFESGIEMGTTRHELIGRVREIDELRLGYERVFGPLPTASPAALPDAAERAHDGSTPASPTPAPPGSDSEAIDRAFANLGKAIAAYERRLRTGPGPFDLHVARLRAGLPRDRVAFPDEAHRGMLLFAGRAGCWRCHHGPSISDGSFHAIGVPPLDGGLPRDRGRLDAIARLKGSAFNAAGRFSDDSSGNRAAITMSLTEDPSLWGAVRTPSLRNVARTAPYMREGQFGSLEEVVRFYSTLEGALADHHGERVLEPLGLSDAEIADLVAFLRTLDGTPPDVELLRAPPSRSPRPMGED